MPRQRVVATLAEAVRAYPLTVVIAPMGYGKTTAARFFAEHDAGNDAGRMLFVSFPQETYDAPYLWRLMWNQLADQGFDLAAILRKTTFPFDAEERRRVFSLCRTIEYPVVLVLDDYHFVHDAAFDAFLREFVREGIPPVSILMLSRTKPALPLEELSLKGKATVLDQNVLAFTEQEAMQLFRLNAGESGIEEPVADADQAARAAWLFSRGWTAAVWLGMQNWRKRGSFSQPADMEALLEENLSSSFTAEERDLLLRLSLLEGFSSEDVRMLAATTCDAAAAISRLQAKGSLIHFDPATGRHYLHDIARRFLAAKLARSDSFPPELYRRAAECYIQRNELIQAAPLLARAGRDEDLLRLIDIVFMPDGSMPLFYHTTEVVNAILSIPWRLRLARPLECITFLYYYLGEPGNNVHRHLLDEAVAHFREATGFSEAQKQALLDELSRIGQFLDSDELSATVENRIGCLAALWKRSFAARPHCWAFGCPHAGYLYLRKPGEYSRIANLIGKTIWAYQDVSEDGVAGSRVLFAAERHLERGEFAEAEHCLRAAAIQGDEFGIPAVRLCAGFVQARLHVARGQAEAGLAAIDGLQDYVERLGHANYDRCLDLARCHINASLGNLAGISGWLKEKHLAPNLLIILMKGYIHSLQGKAMLLAGDYQNLRALAVSLPAGQGAYNNLFGRIHAAVLEALAAWYSNHPEIAKDAFTRAVDLARPDGIILSIAEYGAHVLPLLAGYSGKSEDDQYMRTLIRVAKTIASASVSEKRVAMLTPRQDEFLRMALQGKSNEEIAQYAGVGVGTVKKTLGAAYARLGVKNRTEASRVLS